VISVDFIYINNYGGKELSNFIISKLNVDNISSVVLLDERNNEELFAIKDNSKNKIIKNSIFYSHLYYLKNKNQFSKILCFANLPPSVKCNAAVYTYFHQPLFIETPKGLTFKEKFLIFLKTKVLWLLKNNTDYWIVQSENIKEGLSKRYKIAKKILVIPFYPPLINTNSKIIRKKHTFIYVSSGATHKNHYNLLQAFKIFYDKHNVGQLTLTIDKGFIKLYSYINELINLGYPIQNLGVIDREKLAPYYAENEYLIYPSLTESFGLGLVEAIDNGCKVIGSNLPYMYAVCNPSVVFNPESVEDIVKAIETAAFAEVKPTEKIIKNEIDKLIELLK